jgi:hypothetical protein
MKKGNFDSVVLVKIDKIRECELHISVVNLTHLRNALFTYTHAYIHRYIHTDDQDGFWRTGHAVFGNSKSTLPCLFLSLGGISISQHISIYLCSLSLSPYFILSTFSFISGSFLRKQRPREFNTTVPSICCCCCCCVLLCRYVRSLNEVWLSY